VTKRICINDRQKKDVKDKKNSVPSAKEFCSVCGQYFFCDDDVSNGADVIRVIIIFPFNQ
jgi:hypothetical protein